jgi:putative ABC transport system permease protein
MLLGVSLVFVGLVPIAQALGISPRVAYTAGGLALVALWCLPFTVQRALLPGIRFNFSVWVVGGIMIVLGATWVLMNYAEWLLTGLVAALGRIRSLAPVLRTAVAYPLRNRFRTGTTVAMFTLVVFTLVCGSVTTMTFTQAFNDVKSFGGGFAVRAEVTPAAPVGDMRHALATTPGLNAADYPVVASESVMAADLSQANSGRAPEPYFVRGFDTTFFEHTTYQMAATARGYGSAAEVWRAVSSTPGLAVIDSFAAPHRDNWSFGGLPAFRLSGFFVEDKVFDPVNVDVVDPRTGEHHAVKVVGVLRDSAPLSIAGLLTSQRTLTGFGAALAPTIYHLTVAPGVDPAVAASRLESAFLANGMQADAVSKLLSDNVAANLTMNRLVLGFIALGLIVGVAAMGVISARSVVERRQQIGVLRAIGFQRRQVQASFVAEASFISLVSIVLGTALGLIVARNVIAYVPSQLNWGSVPFVVPWLELVLIFVIVFVACLLTSWAPARRAARVYPADALRYQ